VPNFERRQSATRKTPDPSNKPWTGVIGGSVTFSGEIGTLTPDRPFSLKGVPSVRAIDAAGSTVSTADAATSDGTTIVLDFPAPVDTAVGLVFEFQDRAIRGNAGEYMTTNRIGPPPAPLTIVEAQNDIGSEPFTLYLVFSRPVTLINTTAAFVHWTTNDGGGDVDAQRVTLTQVDDNKIEVIGEPSGATQPSNTCTTSGIGSSVIAADTATPATDVEEIPIDPL